MTGESYTQIGIVSLIMVTVIKECFALVKYRRNGKAGKYVSESLCEERTKRIEENIKSSSTLTQEKLNNISTTLKARPCQKDCES